MRRGKACELAKPLRHAVGMMRNRVLDRSHDRFAVPARMFDEMNEAREREQAGIMKSVLILSATARLKMLSRLRNAFSQPTMSRHFGGSRENGDPRLFSCDGQQGKPCSRLAAKRSTNWDRLVRCSLMRAQKFVKRAFLSDNRCGGSGHLDRLLKLSARSLSTLPDYGSSSNGSGKLFRSEWAGL